MGFEPEFEEIEPGAERNAFTAGQFIVSLMT
jgi:hypothetical protein